MIVIFLDIDGVLNSWQSLVKAYEKDKKAHSCLDYPFEEEAFINLEELMSQTLANIVICSSWLRIKGGFERILEELKKYNLQDYVIGSCDVGYDSKTHRENIINYVNTLGDNINFIVLDDKYIPNLEELIQIDNNVGLTKEDVINAIKKIKAKGQKLERVKNE